TVELPGARSSATYLNEGTRVKRVSAHRGSWTPPLSVGSEVRREYSRYVVSVTFERSLQMAARLSLAFSMQESFTATEIALLVVIDRSRIETKVRVRRRLLKVMLEAVTS